MSATMVFLAIGLAFVVGMACGALVSPWRMDKQQSVSDAWWEGYRCRVNEEKHDIEIALPHAQKQDPRKN